MVSEFVFWAVYDYSKFQNKNNHTLDNAGEAINIDAQKAEGCYMCVSLLVVLFALDIKLLVAVM